MARPRSHTVIADQPGYYHCISRCVRRAWLCGEDPLTGASFEHRRGWVERRLLELADSFSVGLYAWAVMSNHSHIVLYVDPDLPSSWTPEEVAERWSRIHRTLCDEETPEQKAARRRRREEILCNKSRCEEVRQRLGSVSWFMRFLNEAIAIAANREDECTGRFWEGRFQCKALRDDSAILGCMAYVDLNPIRGGIAEDLENSDYTSIRALLSELDAAPSTAAEQLGVRSGHGVPSFPKITVQEYVELVEWTGRKQREKKIGRITGPPPTCLGRITSDHDLWERITSRLSRTFGSAVGAAPALRSFASATGRLWVPGTGA